MEDFHVQNITACLVFLKSVLVSATIASAPLSGGGLTCMLCMYVGEQAFGI